MSDGASFPPPGSPNARDGLTNASGLAHAVPGLPPPPPPTGLHAAYPGSPPLPASPRGKRFPTWAWGIVAAAVLGVVAIAVASSSDDSEPESGSSTSIASVAAGIDFADPQGTYTMTVSEDWVETSGAIVKEIESWTVGPPRDGFAPNVNVLTQTATGMDLDQYMQFSLQHMGGAHVISSSTLQGSNGNELAMLEYSGDVPGAPPGLHFLAVVDVQNEQAVVATFTAPEDSFADLRGNVEPFLVSLQAQRS